MNAAQDTDTALRERALQWLAQREHSRQELQDKLIRWISAQQVVAALRARPRVTPPLPPCRDGKAQQVTDIGHAPAEPDQVAGVVDRLRVSAERAIEVLPLHGTPQRLDDLASMGFTAVSIGAQSFHDPVLRRLGRPHDAVSSRTAVENALGRFDCVDVDLIVDVAWEKEEA